MSKLNEVFFNTREMFMQPYCASPFFSSDVQINLLKNSNVQAVQK